MNTPIFKGGITGISDSKFSGIRGNAHRLVGIDYKSEPGIVKVQQALSDTSVLNEFCKIGVNLPDNSRLWFSSTSGKIWRDANDVFTLVHTMAPVADFKEPNSVTSVFDNDDIEYGISMSISENNFNYGYISDAVSSIIDATGTYNSMCELSSGYYAMAYKGVDNDGFVKTFQITSTDTFELIENLEHDTTEGGYNSICKIDATHFILAYEGGASNQGYIKTFTANFGSLTQTNSLLHDTDDAEYNSIIQIDATHYALAYSGGASGFGYIKIFTIDGAFAITQTSFLIHDNTGATYGHKLVLIDSTHFILSYTNSTGQKIKTFSIDGAYAITEIDSLDNSTGNIMNELIKLDATHYLWSGMISVRGHLKVFEIDGSYQITEKTFLDIGIINLYPSLLKTDENHFVLSSSTTTTGYTKVFEIDSDYEMREVGTKNYLGGKYTSIVRAGRRILTVHTSTTSNYTSVATINETYSNGIILKPSGTSDIKLIASKFYSQATMGSQYLKDTIKIPTGYSDLDVVVVAGRAGSELLPPAGVTINGVAMTQVVNRNTVYGFKCNSAFFNKINPSTGDNEVIVDFGSSSTYTYLAILVFKNVHQTTPYSANTDYGWKDYLELTGATNGELKLGAFLTKINNHSHGDLQNEIGYIDIAESTDRYTLSVGTRKYNIGTAKILSADYFSYNQMEEVATETSEYKPQEQIGKIYYTNENVLFAVPLDKVTDWANNIETVGTFFNGDDTYHPMQKQNLELFIGDKNVISKVNSDGDFIQLTPFNVSDPERIQVLSGFDTDLLVGTKDINKARVLRWDTFSDSWLAEDDVFETGINAFIKDDNFTYVSAGDFGNIYFYNGEKLTLTKRIPGEWGSTKKAIVNPNATDYYMGIPVFGLSNSTGNPALQGIYGFGAYDEKYVKGLSLDFPVPTKELSGVEIGAILVNGSDMRVSYKTGTVSGAIAKINHSKKYESAYIETMVTVPNEDRNDDNFIEGICADYISLPTNTDIGIAIKTKYDTTYTDLTTITDTKRMSIKTKPIPKVVNLQIKFSFTTDANNAPEVENFGIL